MNYINESRALQAKSLQATPPKKSKGFKTVTRASFHQVLSPQSSKSFRHIRRTTPIRMQNARRPVFNDDMTPPNRFLNPADDTTSTGQSSTPKDDTTKIDFEAKSSTACILFLTQEEFDDIEAENASDCAKTRAEIIDHDTDPIKLPWPRMLPIRTSYPKEKSRHALDVLSQWPAPIVLLPQQGIAPMIAAPEEAPIPPQLQQEPARKMTTRKKATFSPRPQQTKTPRMNAPKKAAKKAVGGRRSDRIAGMKPVNYKE
jgi:hypothetical protein